MSTVNEPLLRECVASIIEKGHYGSGHQQSALVAASYRVSEIDVFDNCPLPEFERVFRQAWYAYQMKQAIQSC